MSRTKVEVYIEQMDFARQETIKAANAVPESARLYQPAPGRPTPLWLLGHLGNSVNTVIIRYAVQGESAFPKEWAKVFAPDFTGGTPPSTDASMYPPYDEVIALYDNAMQKAAAALGTLTDEDLGKPLPANLPDAIRAFFPTIGATLNRMIGHDAYHRGQMALLGKLGG